MSAGVPGRMSCSTDLIIVGIGLLARGAHRSRRHQEEEEGSWRRTFFSRLLFAAGLPTPPVAFGLAWSSQQRKAASIKEELIAIVQRLPPTSRR